jgi:hypothetical protein
LTISLDLSYESEQKVNFSLNIIAQFDSIKSKRNEKGQLSHYPKRRRQKFLKVKRENMFQPAQLERNNWKELKYSNFEIQAEKN